MGLGAEEPKPMSMLFVTVLTVNGNGTVGQNGKVISSDRRNNFTFGRFLCLLVGYQKGQVVAPSLWRVDCSWK